MCQHCRQTNEERIRKLEPGESWVCDEEECYQDAAISVVERYVEDHLCPAHAAEDGAEMAGPAGALVEATGLLDGVDYLAIEDDTVQICEWLPLFEAGPCKRPARYAKVVESPFFMCERHAALEGVEQTGMA